MSTTLRRFIAAGSTGRLIHVRSRDAPVYADDADAASGTVRVRQEGGLRIAYLTTIPTTLAFFRGHMEHEASLGSRLLLVSSAADGELEAAAREVGASCVPVEMSRQMAPVADLRSLARLVAVLRAARPDVLQIATPKAGLLGAVAARIARTPVIVVGVFGLPQMTETGWRRRLLDATTRLSTRDAALVWCDSHSMADYVRDRGLAPRSRVGVVGSGSVCGVDALQRFNPANRRADGGRVRDSLGIPRGAKTLGFVGRIAKDKGMRELSMAWAVLRLQHPDTHLLIVGPDDGDLTPNEIPSLRPDNRTHIVGSQEDVGAFVSAMDIFVMPSYREGFCVSNLEASAHGPPGGRDKNTRVRRLRR